ncbi:Testican-1 [Lonchura striata]|uniref:Testican-1 n=1 Tax=Lonchura striata TaxID=40157 RepID=A0A218V2Q5_9PASE|nr:Testican-1 [Lonchura striata domestica]
MSGVLVIAAWCFLQVESRHPEIITSNSNHGNFLDNDKWLSTVSQYDKDKYWNKFRDPQIRSVVVKLDSRELENMTSTEKGWNIKQAELEDLGNSAQLEIDEKENLCTFIDVQSYSKLQKYCYSEERKDTVGMQKMKDFCFY